MPTIAWVSAILIRMFFNDHAPPHFHAVYAKDEAQIAIDTGEVIRGRLRPSARREIREWTLENQAALMENWRRTHADEPLERIPEFANDD